MAKTLHTLVLKIVPVQISKESVKNLGEHHEVVPLGDKDRNEVIALSSFGLWKSDLLQEVLDDLLVVLKEPLSVVLLVTLVQHNFVALHE